MLKFSKTLSVNEFTPIPMIVDQLMRLNAKDQCPYQILTFYLFIKFRSALRSSLQFLEHSTVSRMLRPSWLVVVLKSVSFHLLHAVQDNKVFQVLKELKAHQDLSDRKGRKDLLELLEFREPEVRQEGLDQLAQMVNPDPVDQLDRWEDPELGEQQALRESEDQPAPQEHQDFKAQPEQLDHKALRERKDRLEL